MTRKLFLPALAAALLLGGWFAAPTSPAAAQACDPHYLGVCLPLYTGVDNITCQSPQVTLSSFPVIGTDVYGLDSGGIVNVACEGNGKPAYQAAATATPTRTSTPAPAATATRTNTPALAATTAPTQIANTTPPAAPRTGTGPATDTATSPFVVLLFGIVLIAGATGIVGAVKLRR